MADSFLLSENWRLDCKCGVDVFGWTFTKQVLSNHISQLRRPSCAESWQHWMMRQNVSSSQRMPRQICNMCWRTVQCLWTYSTELWDITIHSRFSRLWVILQAKSEQQHRQILPWIQLHQPRQEQTWQSWCQHGTWQRIWLQKKRNYLQSPRFWVLPAFCNIQSGRQWWKQLRTHMDACRNRRCHPTNTLLWNWRR